MLVISVTTTKERAYHREQCGLSGYAFPTQRAANERKKQGFTQRRRPKPWFRKRTLSIREGLAFNYDVLQALTRRVPRPAAMVDLSWTSQKLATALVGAEFSRGGYSREEPFDPWDPDYPHLAALWLAEKRTKTWAGRWDDMGFPRPERGDSPLDLRPLTRQISVVSCSSSH